MKYSTAAQCLSVVDAFHPASVGWSVYAAGQISEKPSSDSGAVQLRQSLSPACRSLEVTEMAAVARLLGVFHGHQTVAKVSDNDRGRLKVTDERGSSSSAGVEVGDDVPTGL